MIIENMKINTVYHHNFNNAELATTRLMEDLSYKTTNGQFIRIAPNVFLYVSSEEGKCNLIAATPLHYFYSNLDTDNNDIEGDVNSTKLDDNVNEDDDNEIENDSDDIDNETKDSSLHDSIDTDNSTCDNTNDLNTSVLMYNKNNTDINLNQNIDLAHNAIIDNTDDIQQNPINSVNVLIPLSCNSNILENESKDIENKIVNKYNGKVFRHNDLMFTHIRPDGIIDRVLTDESGHNCTSFK